jgi:DNA (cytosine-5)-methyltransferase 1
VRKGTTTRSEIEERRPIAVDVFAGAGGMSLGFEQAGFDVLAAIDNDPVHLAVHQRNLPLAHPVCDDAATVAVGTIHAAIRKGWALAGRPGEWDGTVDCLFGGPSCQGFSDMGSQQPDDERNDLIFAFARLVEELKPRAFVMENVPGLLFPKVRDQLERLQTRFVDAGYQLQSPMPALLNAGDFGVPQRRRRVFIIGVVPGLTLPGLPEAGVGPNVAAALGDLPNVDDYEQLLSSDRLSLTVADEAALMHRASEYVKSLRRSAGLEYDREWDPLVLTGCHRTVHTAKVRRRFASLIPGSPDESSRTHRLEGQQLSRTLRAGTGRDHGSFTAPRPVHYEHHRVITVREAARLHSFPDWFDFNVAKWHAFREIGNSVPPRLAAAVASKVAGILGVPSARPNKTLTLGSDDLLGFSLGTAADHFGYDRAKLSVDVRRQDKE